MHAQTTQATYWAEMQQLCNFTLYVLLELTSCSWTGELPVSQCMAAELTNCSWADLSYVISMTCGQLQHVICRIICHVDCNGLVPCCSLPWQQRCLCEVTSSNAGWTQIELHWFYAHLSNVYEQAHTCCEGTSADIGRHDMPCHVFASFIVLSRHILVSMHEAGTNMDYTGWQG